MKQIELMGYAVSAFPHPMEKNIVMLGIESHMKDAGGGPAERYIIALPLDVASTLAKQLTGGSVEVARVLPKIDRLI